jgi:hypothetical protein
MKNEKNKNRPPKFDYFEGDTIDLKKILISRN